MYRVSPSLSQCDCLSLTLVSEPYNCLADHGQDGLKKTKCPWSMGR